MEHLFKELTFSNGVKARNKFLLAPLTNMQSPDIGKLSNDEFNWLTKRAEGGFGIIMTCAMPVLNSEKYPFMEFKSTNISKKGLRYEINGLLNLRGLKKNVTIFVIGKKDNKENAKTLNFGIKSSINRYEFGADGYSLLVGKEIELNSNIKLIKKE